MSKKLNRRTVLKQMGSATAATLVAGVSGLPPLGSVVPPTADAAEMGPGSTHDRRWLAYRVRHDTAMTHSSQPFPSFSTNGDEEAYPSKIASYTKGLPHNERGEVDLKAYAALLKAVEIGQHAAFEAIPLGGQVKFANPQAAYAFTLEGPDPHQFALIVPPAFGSAETASEMVELYWQALTRDVSFAEYETHALTTAAAADLSRCADFRGPRVNGVVTPASLFRGPTPGDLVGPYLSQFLWLDVYQGSMTLTQQNRVPIANDDYLQVYPEWLNIQRGLPPARINGYKRHLATSLADDLILACAVTPANHPEDEAAEPLKVDLAHQELGPIDELYIDRAYLSSPVVPAILKAGGAVLCRPWGVANGEVFSKQDFKLNLQDKTLTGPGGHPEAFRLGTVVEFPATEYDHCPLRAQGTTAAPGRGRTITIGEDEPFQHRLRQRAATRAGRAQLRQRVEVEHRLAHLGARQGRRARYKGVRKNLFDVRRTAAVLNLQTLQRKTEEQELPMAA